VTASGEPTATTTATRREGETDPPGSEPGRGRRRALLTWAAWAGVLAWGTWAVVLLAGGDRIPGLGVLATPVLALTPFAVAASPVPIVLALALRRWWAAVAACAVAVALVAPVAPRAMGGDQPAAGGPVLRVLSFNTYFGRADPEELLALVRRTGADVLSVQEVTPEAVDRFEEAGLERLLPHSVMDARWGAAGTGLYSRHPLRELPQPAGMRFATPHAEATLPGGYRVQITGVHPAPPIAGAYEAWKRDIGALPAAATSRGPVQVLAGDFNATLDHAVLRDLIGRGYADAADRAGDGLVPTWGGQRGPVRLTIDHILADERSAVTGYDVHDITGSDHRAVFAEIRLP
jgi:endonuclease/exonuclease/phosphatase (EEP) superfamily protein YafD